MKMRRKRPEFKKIMLLIIISFCMMCVVWSFILASVDSYEVNENLSGEMFVTVVGAYVSYVLASYGEKNSRNKYNIDEYGNKRTGEGEKGDG